MFVTDDDVRKSIAMFDSSSALRFSSRGIYMLSHFLNFFIIAFASNNNSNNKNSNNNKKKKMKKDNKNY